MPPEIVALRLMCTNINHIVCVLGAGSPGANKQAHALTREVEGNSNE